MHAHSTHTLFMEEKMQTTLYENSADVGSINDLIGIKNLKVKTLKRQNQYDVENLYNHNISVEHFQPSSSA